MENRALAARRALGNARPAAPAAATEAAAAATEAAAAAAQGDGETKAEDNPLLLPEGADASQTDAAVLARAQASLSFKDQANPTNAQGAAGEAAAADAAAAAVGGEADDTSGDILGFPKDCGPREGVLILSYKRAMHVRAMNHPHLTFERRGAGQVWKCTTDGFFETKVTDCVAANRLPTPESEALELERAAKQRTKWLLKSGVEKNEVLSVVAAEFPPVDPDAPVYYIVSFPLDYDIGMHACVATQVGCGASDCQRAVGCLDPKPLEEPLAQYGVGIMLYFKFQKVMMHYFAAYALVASVTLYFNYEGSGYSPELKDRMIEQSGLTATVFFTTLGSWAEKTVQCRSETESNSFLLECPTGVFTSVEAYYGQPTGTCSCPVNQQLDSNGDCPADPSYDTYSWGECDSTTTTLFYDDDGANSTTTTSTTTAENYCLRGTTPYGSVCCAHSSTGSAHLPDFSDLLPADAGACHSQSVQYVANALCLGQKNCTFEVAGNRTYAWDVATISVLGNDVELGCGGSDDAVLNCSVTLDQGNFTSCNPKYGDKKDGTFKLFVVGTCWSDTMTVNGATYSKTNVAMTFAYLDAFMIAVLMVLIDWVKRRELDEVEEQDASRCTAADFTVRIVELPAGYGDVDVLRKELTNHFEDSVHATLPGQHHELPAPSKVVDINFGFDDQSVQKVETLRKPTRFMLGRLALHTRAAAREPRRITSMALVS
jgi:hypothetical protein